MSAIAYDTSPAALSYALATAACVYVQYRCIVPPNPKPAKEKLEAKDAWVLKRFQVNYVATPVGLGIGLNGVLHGAYSIARPVLASRWCPHPDALDAGTLGWSPATAIATLLMLLGGYIRLQAYAQLGRNFTFELARPSGLMTGGLYGWVQHPSYTGGIVLALGLIPSFLRPDYGLGAFVPVQLLPYVSWVRALSVAAAIALMAAFIPVRVAAEEDMLRRSFGKEWEDYHRRTARLIPGLY